MNWLYILLILVAVVGLLGPPLLTSKMPAWLGFGMIRIFYFFIDSQSVRVAFRALVAAAVALDPEEVPMTPDGTLEYIKTYASFDDVVRVMHCGPEAYSVTEYRSGFWGCDCPEFKKDSTHDCPHILAIKGEQ